MNISKNEQLVVDGNSFYEIDLQCVQKKQSQKHISPKERAVKNRSRQHTISGCATRGSSICNAKKAEGLTSAHHRTSAATAVVSASTSATAEQEQYNDDPAGITAVSAVVTATASIVSTETHQADDPENTAAGIISEKAGSIPHPHPQLLLQPHPSLPHPQFVAAKSLMVKSSRFCSHFIL